MATPVAGSMAASGNVPTAGCPGLMTPLAGAGAAFAEKTPGGGKLKGGCCEGLPEVAKGNLAWRRAWRATGSNAPPLTCTARDRSTLGKYTCDAFSKSAEAC